MSAAMEREMSESFVCSDFDDVLSSFCEDVDGSETDDDNKDAASMILDKDQWQMLPVWLATSYASAFKNGIDLSFGDVPTMELEKKLNKDKLLNKEFARQHSNQQGHEGQEEPYCGCEGCCGCCSDVEPVPESELEPLMKPSNLTPNNPLLQRKWGGDKIAARKIRGTKSSTVKTRKEHKEPKTGKRIYPRSVFRTTTDTVIWRHAWKQSSYQISAKSSTHTWKRAPKTNKGVSWQAKSCWVDDAFVFDLGQTYNLTEVQYCAKTEYMIYVSNDKQLEQNPRKKTYWSGVPCGNSENIKTMKSTMGASHLVRFGISARFVKFIPVRRCFSYYRNINTKEPLSTPVRLEIFGEAASETKENDATTSKQETKTKNEFSKRETKKKKQNEHTPPKTEIIEHTQNKRGQVHVVQKRTKADRQRVKKRVQNRLWKGQRDEEKMNDDDDSDEAAVFVKKITKKRPILKQSCRKMCKEYREN